MCTDMPDTLKGNSSEKLKKISETNSLRAKRDNFKLTRALDLRRFFMPNVDKVIKNVMHEIADGKAAVRETMTSALKNQEIIIAQNKRMTNLLAEINDKLAALTENGNLTREDADEAKLSSE